MKVARSTEKSMEPTTASAPPVPKLKGRAASGLPTPDQKPVRRGSHNES